MQTLDEMWARVENKLDRLYDGQEELKDRMEALDERQYESNERHHAMNLILARQEQSLTEHMRRTAAAEAAIEQLRATTVKGPSVGVIFNTLMVLATLAVSIIALLK